MRSTYIDIIDQDIVLEGRVVNCEDVVPLIRHWRKAFEANKILLGNGTSSDSMGH